MVDEILEVYQLDRSRKSRKKKINTLKPEKVSRRCPVCDQYAELRPDETMCRGCRIEKIPVPRPRALYRILEAKRKRAGRAK